MHGGADMAVRGGLEADLFFKCSSNSSTCSSKGEVVVIAVLAEIIVVEVAILAVSPIFYKA